MDRTFFKRMTSIEAFNHWLDNKDNRLKYLMELLGEKILLDYSLQSIDNMCDWLISTYDDLKVAHNKKDIYILDCCGTYIGEIFISSFGGCWKLEVEEESSGLGYPSIVDFKVNIEYLAPVYPHTWVTSTIGRQTCVIKDRFAYFSAS